MMSIIRPVIHAEIQAGDDLWVKAPVLVDTSADRTVFSVDILRALRLEPVSTEARLGGIGGVASAIIVGTRIRLAHESHQKIMLRGRYRRHGHANP